MALAYSFHISNKSHAITTIKKVAATSKHNLRKYKSKDYDRENIQVLRGSKTNILDDIEAVYHQEFDEAVEKYNKKQKRADRKIDNYLHTVSENSKTDLAVEIILQVGDMKFWQDKSPEEKKRMLSVFQKQLEDLEKLVPEFHVANATAHLDEASPHMHIIGVPVATGYKRGMERQVSKTSVFTKDSLSMLQEKMRISAEKEMQDLPFFSKQTFKPKQKGRNADWSKEYYAMQDALKKAHLENAKLRSEQEILIKTNKTLEKEQNALKSQNTALQEEIGGLRKVKEFLQTFISRYKPFKPEERQPPDPNDPDYEDYVMKLVMRRTAEKRYGTPTLPNTSKKETENLSKQATSILDWILKSRNPDRER